jgi:hypothetical protein
MMTDEDFKKIFVAHKADVPDDGFSERVACRLPERKSILPQIVMALFVMIGLALTLAIQGASLLLDRIGDLLVSISQLQMPSPVSIVTLLSVWALVGFIGYSIAYADV